MLLHPYARESVQSVVGRMGYPPFTLDMIYPETARPDDATFEIEPAFEAEP
jgi:preprotein translocase subunit SecB